MRREGRSAALLLLLLLLLCTAQAGFAFDIQNYAIIHRSLRPLRALGASSNSCNMLLLLLSYIVGYLAHGTAGRQGRKPTATARAATQQQQRPGRRQPASKNRGGGRHTHAGGGAVVAKIATGPLAHFKKYILRCYIQIAGLKSKFVLGIPILLWGLSAAMQK